MLFFLHGFTFIVGSFITVLENIMLSYKDLQSEGKSVIVLPCSLNDLASANEGRWSDYYLQVDFCTTDSSFLTAYALLKSKNKTIQRVYGPHLMLHILSDKNNQTASHYFISPNAKTSQMMKMFICEKYPLIDAKFTFLSNNFTKKNEKEFVSLVKEVVLAKSKFVWLGIGSPGQIKLAAYLKNNTKGVVIFCVGAAFEFLTGQKKQAPFFLQSIGLEWLFRLLSEPKRLWRRYLVTIPKFLFLVTWRKLFFWRSN